MSDVIEPRFLPWLRTGLAAHIDQVADDGLARHDSATVRVAVTLHASGDGVPEVVEEVPSPSFRLRAPGEVIGFDAALVLRRDPPPGAVDAEPNYFALVELASPDLPWRLTPAAASGDRLQPWIALVVVERRPGVTLTAAGGDRCPVVHLDDPSSELPPAEQTWAWAHVHADADLADGLPGALSADPSAFRTRLLCPRRLTPNRSWLACVVPTFESGRLAGLGADPASATSLRSWDHTSTAPLDLPVYHSWTFQTGAGGDFESLARRLRPQAAPPGLGRADLDIGDPGGGMPSTPGLLVSFEGALLSPAGTSRSWSDPQRGELVDALRRAVNDTLVRAGLPDPYDAIHDDPVIGPPGYGATQAHRRRVPGDDRPPLWLGSLNTEPPLRSVAGLGAAVVRRDQEALMATAWDYAAQARDVNHVLDRARVAAEVASVATPAFNRLSDAEVVQIAGPALTRLNSDDAGTVRGAVASSALPSGLVSGAFRRVCQTATGLSRRAPDGTRSRPTTQATRAYLADAPDLVNRWASISAPAGTDLLAGLDGTDGGDGPDGGDAAPRQSASIARPALPSAMPLHPVIVMPPAAVATSSLAVGVRAGIDPSTTIRNMLTARISGLDPARHVDVPPATSVRPVFTTPMYAPLAELSGDALCPGIGEVARNSVVLLDVNAAFVEACLAGINHEMGREFRWREFPASLDDTWFQRFWDRVDGGNDVVEMRSWDGAAGLGVNAPNGGTSAASLALLVNGDLLRRYPDVKVYAVEAQWHDGARREKPGGAVALPVFTGTLRPGTSFFGFSLDQDDVRGTTAPGDHEPGWFFVFEEQPHLPRFGLDAPKKAERGVAPDTWADLTWSNLSSIEGALADFAVTDGPEWMLDAGSLPGNGGRDHYHWGDDAATMASITLQQPVRLLLHGDSLLPAKETP